MPVITPGSTIVGAVQISGLAPNSTPIESWLNGMLQGKAFSMWSATTPVAAEYSFIELRNPAGSGHNLWVYNSSAFPQVATTILYGFSTPPLLAGGNHGANLLTGALNSVGMVATGANAAWQGTIYASIPAPANTPTGQIQPWLIVLAPNCSMIVNNGVVNDALTANFSWMEV